MSTDVVALPSIAIIGAGSMGGAILQGLVRSGLATSGVTVTNRTRAKAEALADLDGVTSLAGAAASPVVVLAWIGDMPCRFPRAISRWPRSAPVAPSPPSR